MEFCTQCNSLLDITNNVDNIFIQKGGSKLDILFDFILNDENIDEIKKMLEDFNIEIIKKSNEYQSLSIDKQEIIYNKIQSILPKNKKEFLKKSFKSNNPSVYYTCIDCKYSYPLKSGTNIYSEIKNKQNIEDYKNYLYSNIHPHTSEYVCINSNCLSHKNGGLAIYFRVDNKIMLICKECNSQFYKN